MKQKRNVNIILFVLFFVFSIWLFGKSFGYENEEFRIARHQVGDFGLHLSLARSFSWGSNWFPESPFYPGEPLPYHYGVDLFAGLLERIGVRIDHAFNGISVIFFTILLLTIYRLSNILLGYNPSRSFLSVLFFLFSSNLTFVTFLQRYTLADVWRLPDYLYKGPFDGSTISIFSTLNPLLNQRHLVVGLALGMLFISFLVQRLMKSTSLSQARIVTMGILLGLGTRIHALVALGVVIVVCCLFLLFRRIKLIIPFIAFTALFALPHINEVFRAGQNSYNFFHPGFLAAAPVTLSSWFTFWWQNLGLALVFLPIGFFLSKNKQKRVFFSFLPLFILANIFQFSYRIEHNHSLITMFLIVANIFVAHAITRLPKIGAAVSLFFLTASGILNFMVVKNDFQYRVADAPKDTLISWIAKNTPRDSIFLAPQNLYDPVTLAGRKNYFGATYYSEVMGYDVEGRRAAVNQFFETGKIEGVDYLIFPESVAARKPVFTNEKFWVYKL